MLKLNTIRKTPGATKSNKRVGRGAGSGRGGHMSTRGGKGQKARSGGSTKPGFEGGQTPIYRRLPKKGFKSLTNRAQATLNVCDLERLAVTHSEISPESLKNSGTIRKISERLVILGTGDLTKSVKVKAHRVSEGAKAKIEKAGGSIELIAIPTTDGKKKTKRAVSASPAS